MGFDNGRVEAFSDGVIAIAITLLVLEIRLPDTSGQSLAVGLEREWPAFAAYAVSFLVIGIIWINHHAMLRSAKAFDRPALFANLALLATVAVIPFPTRLVADYLRQGYDGRVAVAVYGATMFAMSVAFTVLWLTLTREDADLLHEHLEPAAARAAIRRFSVGLAVYAVATGIAFVNAYLALTVHALIALYYCFDQLNSGIIARPRATS